MPLTIKKILVPVDFSEISIHALDYAILLAKKFSSNITLLHVIESYKYNTALKVNPKIKEIIKEGIDTEFRKLIRHSPELDGWEVDTIETEGKIYREIVKIARKKNFDLIVMGTHGTSGIVEFEKFMLGSNAYRVVHSSPCPVITVKEKKGQADFKNILLPLDMTKETTKKIGLAAYLAEIFHAMLHIVSVSTTLEEYVLNINEQIKRMSEVKKFLKATKIPFSIHMLRDVNIAEGILDYGKKIHADLIMILTKEENKMKEFLLGSNARKIITHSQVPVLSLIPEKHTDILHAGHTLYMKKSNAHGEFAVKETLPFYYPK